ncbi:MAG: hypothetical protein IPH13_09765 [Planctomycetes bacterium]|nr:hypothetical protein [Planctomycetota bacterium]MCC7171838.1 hypothetical protein [Planctomycetota bacterium]
MVTKTLRRQVRAGATRAGAKTAVQAVREVKRTPQKRETNEPVFGRFAAPRVRLGMTAGEVKKCAGSPDCILFGTDENVDWQFGTSGFDALGAPALYVTQLTFHAGRVVKVIERMSAPTH